MNLAEDNNTDWNNSFLFEEESLCMHNITRKQESLAPPFLLFLSGLPGNILALFILICSVNHHKWRPFYRLVFALAITDGTISVLVIPVVLKTYVTNFEYCFTKLECYYVSFLYSFSWLGSAMLVTSLSLDRFLAVVIPMWYKRYKYFRTNLLIFCSWTFCALISMLPLVGVGKVKMFYPDTWCFINYLDSKNISSIVVTYIYSIVGLVIFTATFIMNIAVILMTIRRIMTNRKTTGARKRLKSDIYILLFLVTISLVFSVCWVPLMVCTMTILTKRVIFTMVSYFVC